MKNEKALREDLRVLLRGGGWVNSKAGGNGQFYPGVDTGSGSSLGTGTPYSEVSS